jgi:hypothetical protein
MMPLKARRPGQVRIAPINTVRISSDQDQKEPTCQKQHRECGSDFGWSAQESFQFGLTRQEITLV